MVASEWWVCCSAIDVTGARELWTGVIAILWLMGCHAAGSVANEVAQPVSTSPDSIPIAPLGGVLLSHPFALQSARFWIDRRPGYEKIDVKLSAGRGDSPCAEPRPRDAPSVWLRHSGTTHLGAETLHIDQNGPGPWEVHYQVMQDGLWEGSGKADALLVLHPLTADQRLPGELSVCFADKAKSCVLGNFVADYCPASIDAPVRGTQMMEGPVAVQRPDDKIQTVPVGTPEGKP
jgi:hypothetical protein